MAERLALLACCALLLAFPAHADVLVAPPGVLPTAPVYVPAAPDFSDWFSVTARLQSQGVDVTATDWASIDPLCVPLMTTQDNSAFQQCRYEKALLQHAFAADRASCQRRASAIFPDKLNAQRPLRVYRMKDADGHEQEVQEFGDPLSLPEITALRDTEADFCLREFGWQDGNWAAGKLQP
jgi:hypothetical protein